MEFDTYTIVYLITNLFNIVVLHRFMITFFDKRRVTAGVCALTYIFHFVVSSLLYLYVDIPLLTLLVNFLLIYLISLNYKANALKHILSSLYTLAFCLLTEVIVAAYIGYFQYSVFTEGNFSSSMGLIAMRLISYMEALLLYNFKSIRRNYETKLSVWLASVLIPVITFILHAFIVNSDDATQTKVLVATVLILLINVTTFYLYDSLATSYIKIAENAVLEKERELYFNQCTMMQNSTNELRAFRHDLKNQLIGVSELISGRRYEEAKKLVGGLSGKLNTKLLFSTTGNISVDSIINYKLQNTGNEQIRVETEIAIPAEFDMDIADCITVLGNLLDNALYALQQVEEQERYLKLEVVFDKGRLMIQCANPYVTEVQYEKGRIVSAKTDRTMHGFGLKNIESVAKKYGGYMNVNHGDGTFIVDVLLYLPVDCKK
ncbi:MAG: GHKL domain-containing protein [Lachnospiraceae bacterium]|nr:GHKL domain-containing protein [Lachnospiraceae bacterium]